MPNEWENLPEKEVPPGGDSGPNLIRSTLRKWKDYIKAGSNQTGDNLHGHQHAIMTGENAPNDGKIKPPADLSDEERQALLLKLAVLISMVYTKA